MAMTRDDLILGIRYYEKGMNYDQICTSYDALDSYTDDQLEETHTRLRKLFHQKPCKGERFDVV